MTALLKLSLFFFASSVALANDSAQQIQEQAVVIQEQVEQAEQLEQDLVEILHLLAGKKAAEEAVKAEEAVEVAVTPALPEN